MTVTAMSGASLPSLSSRSRCHPLGELRAREPEWVVFGDPGDNRVRLFAASCERLGVPAPSVVDYRTILRAPTGLPFSGTGAIVRLESPGRATDLHLAFLEAGAELAEEEGSPVVRGGEDEARQYERGRILSPRQWFLGFQSTLEQVRRRLESAAPRYSSHPDDITHLFEKPRCHATFSAAGLRVPRSLELVGSFAELDAKMTSAGISRVFVKLAHGSAASGVLAYRRSPTQDLALTTVEVVQDGREPSLFNTRRLRRLRCRAEIAAVVDALCRFGVHVEHWVPKAGLAGRTFDLRVLTVGGEPAHIVVRLASGPITNLHLRGERAGAHALLERMPEHSHRQLLEACRRAARLFPRSLQVSFDVAVTPDFRSHAILEANAFGDLLKGIEHDGLSTYEAELMAAARLLSRRTNGYWFSS